MNTRKLESLDQLMDGALYARFNRELEKVWQNVFDFSTDPDKAREITITFKIKPDKRRETADMKTDIKVRLAPPVPLQQTVFMDHRDDGSVHVTEMTDQIPGQMDMGGNEQAPPHVVVFENPKLAKNKG